MWELYVWNEQGEQVLWAFSDNRVDMVVAYYDLASDGILSRIVERK